MTPEQLQAVAEVQAEVNAIPFEATPGPMEPVDYWEWQPEPGRSWVCRDFTERKAELLRERGFDPTWLTVILCFVETGEYHAVLGITEGDWRYGGVTTVLDSRFPQTYEMHSPPAAYRWDRRQIPGTEEFEQIS